MSYPVKLCELACEILRLNNSLLTTRGFVTGISQKISQAQPFICNDLPKNSHNSQAILILIVLKIYNILMAAGKNHAGAGSSHT